ncbi:MAG: acetate kinase [Clostridium baratii]|uniref:Acetate kinase n=1 Tax=Clostridium baratii str. Sullivan TaxID=1415775 RepID=A0A0A7G1E9_9CLOT|nr:acetate kinase [Clostridium baratii]AIY84810.1 acetate kinase [Clostridium baratii str. Sullivan]MBS6006715.1 acetate kinase [Clostridium baratii]MDU1053612.1 acetate kinase [Clostridium baratii]MDU4910344.1 acetate kinase [Clostridium baratii]CUO99308.1 acetate kinase [Clostridium baratii]
MKILVINCGSSSLKYQLINMENEEVLAQGLVERIGIEGSILTQKVEGRDKYIIEQPMKDHQDAIKLVLDALVDDTHGVIKSMDEISAVGHRVVHGGEKYSKSVLVDDEVMNYLEECVKLAPLHNPPNIIGINACKALMPNTPMAVVFDTAFHQTMPAKAFTYAIPYELYQKHGIRRYGFHGTSHKYVSRKVAEVMGKNIEDLKIITCHLGNGGSLTAVDGGKSVDTSMGFTPLEGIVMGTRSGNIDPAIITYLINELGYTSEEVNTMLNKKSGLLGISELSSDFRDIRDAAFDRKEERAILTKDVFFYSIKKQIGAYAAAMGGVDVIVFTAGIGENSMETREGVLEGLEFLGVKLDKEKNAIRADINEISTDDSRVKAYVIATNEELMIAKETLELIN